MTGKDLLNSFFNNISISGKEHVVEFDFLGKDSIRYHNFVQVEKRVFKNLQLFMDNKKEGDDLFDRLNTSILNEYLSSLMPGLTAKVFRTYNASITLQEQLNKLSDADDNIAAKVSSKKVLAHISRSRVLKRHQLINAFKCIYLTVGSGYSDCAALRWLPQVLNNEYSWQKF